MQTVSHNEDSPPQVESDVIAQAAERPNDSSFHDSVSVSASSAKTVTTMITVRASNCDPSRIKAPASDESYSEMTEDQKAVFHDAWNQLNQMGKSVLVTLLRYLCEASLDCDLMSRMTVLNFMNHTFAFRGSNEPPQYIESTNTFLNMVGNIIDSNTLQQLHSMAATLEAIPTGVLVATTTDNSATGPSSESSVSGLTGSTDSSGLQLAHAMDIDSQNEFS